VACAAACTACARSASSDDHIAGAIQLLLLLLLLLLPVMGVGVGKCTRCLSVRAQQEGACSNTARAKTTTRRKPHTLALRSPPFVTKLLSLITSFRPSYHSI
jgi:hypothetical protein